MSFPFDKFYILLFAYLDIVKYGGTHNSLWCKDNKDVDDMNGCVNDWKTSEKCQENVRSLCDNDPNCFGFTYHVRDKKQPLKLCLSTEMEQNPISWRTMMKLSADKNCT